jgi:hypothetical protein
MGGNDGKALKLGLGFSTLYAGDDYIGIVPAKIRVAYQAEPGPHMFMIVGESADFMKAELAAGKTYYALVSARMGAWKARFSLNPVNANTSREKIAKWMKSSDQVVPNEKGLAWIANHKPEILKLKGRYLPKWLEKEEARKQIRRVDDGIEPPQDWPVADSKPLFRGNDPCDHTCLAPRFRRLAAVAGCRRIRIAARLTPACRAHHGGYASGGSSRCVRLPAAENAELRPPRGRVDPLRARLFPLVRDASRVRIPLQSMGDGSGVSRRSDK